MAWALCPFAAIIVIVLVDLATHDASVTAQVFFFFPTVYARRAAAETGRDPRDVRVRWPASSSWSSSSSPSARPP